MAALRDLRDWIALLEREGELHRIGAEVDPYLEITAIVDRLVKSGGGPALLFENPKGSEHPLLINQFGTERRMCMALGTDGIRGELTLIRASRALAAIEGAAAVADDHLRRVAAPSLRHRLRRNPLDDTGATVRVERAIAEVFAA